MLIDADCRRKRGDPAAGLEKACRDEMLCMQTSGGGAIAGTGYAYEILSQESVAAYVRSRDDLSERLGPGPIVVRDVADGNLNSVFVVRTHQERPGLVIKQALPWVRVHGEGWPLTPERAVSEERGLRIFRGIDPDVTPELYGFDRERYALAMEDLGDLRVWRDALNDGEAFEAAAVSMGRFVARIAFHTSELGMDPSAIRKLREESVNDVLCRITEDLVLTEPFIEHEHNRHHPAIQGLVDDVRGDRGLLEEVANLKHIFMTHGEALIHGDLHTGSVMVGPGRAVAIDPEFCFYGPVGFDLGALWANFVISSARARVLRRPATFQAAVDGLLASSWQAFTDELRRLWPSGDDPFMRPRYVERYLRSVFGDALGFAGAKATRRMIGYAHVADIETLEEPGRARASGAVLRVARRFILERDRLASPREAWAVVDEELAELGPAVGP
jgi:5-methylthioribose kinase